MSRTRQYTSLQSSLIDCKPRNLRDHYKKYELAVFRKRKDSALQSSVIDLLKSREPNRANAP